MVELSFGARSHEVRLGVLGMEWEGGSMRAWQVKGLFVFGGRMYGCLGDVIFEAGFFVKENEIRRGEDQRTLTRRIRFHSFATC